MSKSIYAEKYRPNHLDDIVGQEHVIEYIKSYIENDDIPHMLFAGPAGVGKTTVGKALARDLYGDDWKTYFLEVNASDETGVDNIRLKVKQYARTTTVDREYKIVFFDEADHLSQSSQATLRRIMEQYSDRCRFIFSCNFPEKIIDPIIDRCVVFRFRSIKKEDMLPILNDVVDKEDIDMKPSVVEIVGKLSYGSLRRALNILHQLKKGGRVNIDKEEVYKVTGYLDEEKVREMLSLCLKKDIEGVKNYLDMLLLERSYSPKEILRTLREIIESSTKIPRSKKIKSILKLSETSFKISAGGESDVHILAFLLYFMSLFGVD